MCARVVGGLTVDQLRAPSRRNQGIWRTGRNALVAFAFAGLLAALWGSCSPSSPANGFRSPMLDTAAARVLLRKVGGGYLFVHLLLLEHFATVAKDDVSPDRATLRATNDPDAERGPSYGEADGAMDMVNFNPPGGRPICVAGLHWLGLVITSRHTAPVVAAIEWRTSRGERASNHQTVLHELLARTHEAWGREVRHVFDRGFASGSWLHTLLERELRFVLRWKKGQKLLDGWGELRKAW